MSPSDPTPPDVYSEMIAAGFHPVRATQESLYRAFITIGRAQSIREGWYEAYCDLCGSWQTSGVEPVAENAAYEHITGHVEDLERAGWAPAGKFAALRSSVERMTPVVEAAKEIVHDWWKQVAAGETFDDDVLPLEAALVRAVDTYEAKENTDG